MLKARKKVYYFDRRNSTRSLQPNVLYYGHRTGNGVILEAPGLFARLLIWTKSSTYYKERDYAVLHVYQIGPIPLWWVFYG